MSNVELDLEDLLYQYQLSSSSDTVEEMLSRGVPLGDLTRAGLLLAGDEEIENSQYYSVHPLEPNFDADETPF